MNTNEEQEYKIALAEVDDILRFADLEILNKIPKSFIKFIKDNKAKYITNINPYLPIQEQNITEKTRAIISLIYRSYLANPEEKGKFAKEDMLELEQIEIDKRIKYNPDNIFKKSNIIETTNVPMVIEKKTAWQKAFEKIRDILKNIFHIS